MAFKANRLWKKAVVSCIPALFYKLHVCTYNYNLWIMRSKLKWFSLLLLCIKLLYENCLRKSVYTNCRSKFYKWQNKLELISHYEYMKRNPCAVYWFHNKRDDSGIASVYVGKIGFNIITYTVFVQNVVDY